MLKTKKVLFIVPEYFNYCALIKTALESLGASVDLFYNRPTSKISKLFFVFLPKYYEKIKNNYFKKLLKQIASEYKYILMIESRYNTVSFPGKVKDQISRRNIYPNRWDDIHLFPKLLDSLKCFK